MIKNYFFLNRFVLEAETLLVNQKIHSVFSQEKEKLIIEFGNEDSRYLEICVNPGNPYIIFLESYSRAKKNTIDLFPEFEKNIIDSFEIATDDRIIRLKSGSNSLFFTIRGKFTNVISVNSDGSIQAFKKIDENDLEKIKEEFFGKYFTNIFNIPELGIFNENVDLKSVGEKYPVISKEIIWETEQRLSNTKNNSLKFLEEVIIDIKNAHSTVFINEQTAEVHLAVDTFRIFNYDQQKTFDSIITAQTYFLAKKYFYDAKASRLKIIKKFIDRESGKISNKINNLRGVIERGRRDEEYSKIANLLLINLKNIKPGQTEIVLEDIYAGNEKLKIKLDTKLSPKKNVDRYFEKAKSEKIGFQKSKELLEKAIKDLNKLKSVEQKIEETESIKELDLIMRELKLKPADPVKEKDDISSKFKHYIIDEKYNVYVGKDSKNNDLLTTRFAKQNDYWFHARSVSGSHVVLRVDNSKEVVPKSVLKKAAALAAYHSKAKTSGVAPVSFTFKKYVVKKKGFPAGTVHLLREDTLLVKPEIPNGCEYVEKD
jgi:predicted ribosome quality control (RQC) complex YloA/Tae2 family protein